MNYNINKVIKKKLDRSKLVLTMMEIPVGLLCSFRATRLLGMNTKMICGECKMILPFEF